MRLSEVKGEHVLDVIADIVVPVGNIAQDEKAAVLFKRETAPEGVSAKDFAIAKIQRGLPVLLKDHKQDIIQILASLADVSGEEYTENMTLASLSKDVIELLTDEEFIRFFTRA